MQVQQLWGVVEQLQAHIQDMRGKNSGLTSQLSDLRMQLRDEKKQSQEAHQSLVREQKAGTHYLWLFCFTTINQRDQLINDWHNSSRSSAMHCQCSVRSDMPDGLYAWLFLLCCAC